jgi:hypothetical protein
MEAQQLRLARKKLHKSINQVTIIELDLEKATYHLEEIKEIKKPSHDNIT